MVTLTRPQFGSAEHVETFVLQTRTAGDQLRQIRPNNWGSARRFRWVFTRLTREQVDSFIIFVFANAGLTILVDDGCGNSHNGIIISDEIEITQTHRAASGQCEDSSLFTFSFEFEEE